MISLTDHQYFREMKSDMKDFHEIVAAAGWDLVSIEDSNVHIVSLPTMSYGPQHFTDNELFNSNFSDFLKVSIVIIDVIIAMLRVHVAPRNITDLLKHFCFSGHIAQSSDSTFRCAFTEVHNLVKVSLVEADLVASTVNISITDLMKKHSGYMTSNLDDWGTLKMLGASSLENLHQIFNKAYQALVDTKSVHLDHSHMMGNQNLKQFTV